MRDRFSHALALDAALAVAALVGSALGACSPQAAPSDEAIARYVGQTATGAPATTPVTNPAELPAAPIATRISITVESGVGLQDHDGPGVSDPYVILEVEGNRARTSVVEGSLAPVWGDSFAFDIRPSSVVQLKLMDEDSFTSDELIGTVVLPIPALHVGERQTLVAAFKNGEEGKVTLTLVGLGAVR